VAIIGERGENCKERILLKKSKEVYDRYMRGFGRFLAGFFFVLFFLPFLLLGTVKFAILNTSFIFGSLKTHHVYQNLPSAFAKSLSNDPNLSPDEKVTYAQIVSSIPPAKVQILIEKNLSNIIAFLNGEKKDMQIRLAASDLHIPGNDINWSLSSSPGANGFIVIYGISTKILLVWVGLLVLLVLLFFASGNAVLLAAGLITLLISIVGKVFLFVIVQNTPMREPAQVLLVTLSNSILADITSMWIVVGIVLLFLWWILRRKNK